MSSRISIAAAAAAIQRQVNVTEPTIVPPTPCRNVRKHVSSNDDDDDDSKPPPPAAAKKKFKLGFKTRTLLPKHSSRTNDEIHSYITMCPVMRAIMDTPQFQRLRGLKQLGTADHVYMNANHNRFEHSMGVAHLAEQMCLSLQQRQPQLCITPKDVLCCKLAGALHDLGHGPFSHLYEHDFPKALERYLLERKHLKQEQYDGLPEIPPGWNHERVGLDVMDALLAHLGLAIDYHNLDAPLKQIGDGIDCLSMRVFDSCCSGNNEQQIWDESVVLTSRDWIFIKELIVHTPIVNGQLVMNDNDRRRVIAPHESGYTGRPQRTKEFLYMIVANLFSGLDVDKLDYIARDQRQTFRSSGEIEHRILKEAFVAWAECPNKKACPRCKVTEKQCTSYKKLTQEKRVSDDDDDDELSITTTTTKKKNEYPKDGMHLMICYPEKMADELPTFFSTRFSNHKKVYRHKTTQAATFMIVDILTQADPFFRVPTYMEEDEDEFPLADKYRNFPTSLPISRASLHPISHLRLRDSILDQIMHTTDDPRLKEARKLIQRYWNRDFYKCVMERQIKLNDKEDMKLWGRTEDEICQELLDLKKGQQQQQQQEQQQQQNVDLTEQDIIVEKMKIHHGSGPSNPVLRMKFLSKQELDLTRNPNLLKLPIARTIEEDNYAAHFHKQFQKFSIRIFCKTSGIKADVLRRTCELWKNNATTRMTNGDDTTTTMITQQSLEQTTMSSREEEEDDEIVCNGPTTTLQDENDEDDDDCGGIPLTQDDDEEEEDDASNNEYMQHHSSSDALPLSQPDEEDENDY